MQRKNENVPSVFLRRNLEGDVSDDMTDDVVVMVVGGLVSKIATGADRIAFNWLIPTDSWSASSTMSDVPSGLGTFNCLRILWKAPLRARPCHFTTRFWVAFLFLVPASPKCFGNLSQIEKAPCRVCCTYWDHPSYQLLLEATCGSFLSSRGNSCCWTLSLMPVAVLLALLRNLTPRRGRQESRLQQKSCCYRIHSLWDVKMWQCIMRLELSMSLHFQVFPW